MHKNRLEQNAKHLLIYSIGNGNKITEYFYKSAYRGEHLLINLLHVLYFSQTIAVTLHSRFVVLLGWSFIPLVLKRWNDKTRKHLKVLYCQLNKETGIAAPAASLRNMNAQSGCSFHFALLFLPSASTLCESSWWKIVEKKICCF